MLFGTNGIRGKFDYLTPELTLKISQAIGVYFGGKGKRVGVAKDARLTGECLEAAVVSGLLSVGCNVVKFGIISTPTAEFALEHMKLDGLVIVTASHNPPDWNALKVVDSKGVSISRERGGEIEKLMGNIKLCDWDSIGKIETYDKAVEDHIEGMIKFLDVEKIKKRKPKVVLDPGNGATCEVIRVFEKVGCEVTTINDGFDGKFPNRLSEPTKENVSKLISKVKEFKADLGVAWDGDGDRVILVDENGEYVIGDKVFAISTMIKLKEKKGEVVTTVSTSMIIEDIAKEFGSKVVYTKVGSPYLSEYMIENKERVVLSGEEVGGVAWPELSLSKDGIFTTLKIVELVCDEKLSLVIEKLPKYHRKKIKIKVKDDKEKFEKVQMIKEFAKSKNYNTIEVDGVRINFEDSWTIIRASGTEDIVRIFAESKTKERVEELIEMMKRAISSS